MIYALTAIIIILIAAIMWQIQEHKKERGHWQRERAEEHGLWIKERQQLIDRIQAGTFAEYKQAEVKVIKAQNGEKEPPKLEPM